MKAEEVKFREMLDHWATLNGGKNVLELKNLQIVNHRMDLVIDADVKSEDGGDRLVVLAWSGDFESEQKSFIMAAYVVQV